MPDEKNDEVSEDCNLDELVDIFAVLPSDKRQEILEMMRRMVLNKNA